MPDLVGVSSVSSRPVLVEDLTWRENEILSLLADHLSDQEIAIKLSLSVSTVKWHVRQILGKLSVSNRRQAVQRAIELGILEDQAAPSHLDRARRLPGDDPELPVGVALKARQQYPNTLPVQPTPFIGRAAEVAGAVELILSDHVRLVTITGVGGSGKTRVALQACVELANHPNFKENVFFIPLSSIRDPGLVILTIAQNVGIKEVVGRSIIEFVTEALHDQHLLLLLDNFEQVISAAPLVAELLSRCPNLKILVTSREPLRVRGEREIPLQPFPLPDLNKLPSTQVLSQYAAIELFMQRAQAVKPDFSLTPENAPAIVEICARVDGLPLGIELAAARVKLLPPQAMLKRLEHRLAFLTGGARDLPERQQTLRRTIDWSYDLLSKSQQILLNRMSVFVGGCTAETAESVCNADKALKGDLLDGLASLLDQNMIRQEETGDEPRFALLEVIREYGLERLKASGQMEALSQRHAVYFLSLTERADPLLETPEQALWLDRLQREYENIRAALDWFVDTGAAEEGLRFGITLWRFWEIRGYLTEGRARLSQLLDMPEAGAHTKLRMKAVYAAGVLAYAQCDYETARSLFEENLAISPEMGDPYVLITSLNNLGNIYDVLGDYNRSHSNYSKALAISQELQDPLGIAWALKNLANVAYRQGEYLEARRLYEESLELWRRLRVPGSIAAGLNDIGNVANAQGDYSAARSAYQSSLEIFRKLGHEGGAAIALHNLGNVVSAQGNYAEARQLYRQSLAIAHTLGDRRSIARLLESLANLAAVESQPKRAARLASAAAKLRTAVSAPLSPVEQSKVQQTLDLARQMLPAQCFASAWSEGQALPLEDALEYASADDDSCCSEI